MYISRTGTSGFHWLIDQVSLAVGEIMNNSTDMTSRGSHWQHEGTVYAISLQVRDMITIHRDEQLLLSP
jgi:hypothetical protein